jgi:uncharacterized phiE125 gp8 family phage protein
VTINSTTPTRRQVLPWDYGMAPAQVKVVTPPTEEPVSVTYVRDTVLRADATDVEDEAIRRWIKAAREVCEYETGRALMTQTLALVMDRFPYSEIQLPFPPLQSVESISYVDENGDDQDYGGSPAEYIVSTSGRDSRAIVRPIYGESFTGTRSQPNAVTITYIAGYASAEDLPEEIITGICLMVGELYKQRTLSVHAVHNTPSLLQTRRFWKRVW